MYVKLIQPKMKKRPMDTDVKTRMSPPLGLYTIANILRDVHKISVENENIETIDYDDTPDIVGITITVDVLNRAIEIAKKFREKGIPVVAGGIYITTARDYIPADCFDVLCVGMAEGTWPAIMEDLEKGQLKPVYQCQKELTGSDIVAPAYDMIKSSEYLYCNIIHTSRGCPFRCDFCYNSAKERSYLKRPIETVIEDIRAVKSKHVMIIDDNFAGDIAWTKKLVRAIKPLHIKWNAAVSINIADHLDLLDQMKESGCQSLFIGFESINGSSIAGVHKVQNNIEKYESAVEAIHSRGIMINASFVFGLDSDTPDTFRQTLDWIVSHRIETVTSHILTPYPGTKLYQSLLESDRIKTFDLSRYNTAHVVFEPAQMTEKELYKGYLWIYKKIYSFHNILRRMPKAKHQILPYLAFNLLYRKFGRVTDFLCKRITYRRIGVIGERIARYFK